MVPAVNLLVLIRISGRRLNDLNKPSYRIGLLMNVTGRSLDDKMKITWHASPSIPWDVPLFQTTITTAPTV